MSGSNVRLHHLHALHGRLRSTVDQLQAGPRRVKVRQQMTANKQAEIEAQKEKIKRLKMAADQGQLQIKSSEAKVDGLQTKLNQAVSNREYDALKSQIEADKMANSVLEDEVLAALDKIDVAKNELTKLEDELKQLQSAEAKLLAEVQAAEAGLRAESANLEKQVAQSEGVIPEDMRLSYRRLVKSLGPDAFAEIEGKQCQGCFVTMTPQNMVDLKAGKVMFCKSCGKLIYIKD